MKRSLGLIFVVLLTICSTSTSAGIATGGAKVAIKSGKIAITKAGKEFLKTGVNKAPKIAAKLTKSNITKLKQRTKILALKTFALARMKTKSKKAPNEKSKDKSSARAIDLLTEIGGLTGDLALMNTKTGIQPTQQSAELIELNPKLKTTLNTVLKKSFELLNEYIGTPDVVDEQSKEDVSQLVQVYQDILGGYFDPTEVSQE